MKEQIKAHVKKYKTVYCCVATGIVIAGITGVIMRGRYEALAFRGAYGPKTADTSVTMRPLCFLSKQRNVVSITHKHAKGRPGYLIRNLDTNEYFSSQRQTARIFNISENVLSRHLSGKLDNVEGLRFERVSVTK